MGEAVFPDQCVVEGIALHWQELEGTHLGLYLPVDPNALLEEVDVEEFLRSDERMPYFGTLWPAAVTLAEEVLEGTSLEGLRVLDLGCGVGAAGLAAAQRGARVTYLDWEPRAMPIVRLSARRLGLEVEDVVVADWRQAPPLDRFDRVLAADVLYEERNVPAVAAFLAAHLTDTGQALLTDPGRPPAKELLPEALRQGMVLCEQHRVTPEVGPPIDVITVRLAREEDR